MPDGLELLQTILDTKDSMDGIEETLRKISGEGFMELEIVPNRQPYNGINHKNYISFKVEPYWNSWDDRCQPPAGTQFVISNRGY